MKKIITCLIILLVPLMAQQETALNTQSQTQQIIENNSQIAPPEDSLVTKHEQWETLPYGHIQGFVPGIGVCFRTPSAPYRLEFDVKVASFFGFVSFLTGSVSAMKEYSTITGTSYFGLGGGVLTMNTFLLDTSDTESFPIVTTFVGYQGKKYFTDLGLEVIPTKDRVIGSPYMRLGIRY